MHPPVQIALACAVSAVIGKFLDGSFAIPDSDYTASCGLSMVSSSVCIAGYVTTAVTIVLCLVLIGMQVCGCCGGVCGGWGTQQRVCAVGAATDSDSPHTAAASRTPYARTVRRGRRAHALRLCPSAPQPARVHMVAVLRGRRHVGRQHRQPLGLHADQLQDGWAARMRGRGALHTAHGRRRGRGPSSASRPSRRGCAFLPPAAAVEAMSWCTMALFIASFLVSAMTVSAAAREAAKLSATLRDSSSARRFSQPASPPVSPCKSSKSFGSAYGACGVGMLHAIAAVLHRRARAVTS